MDLRPWPASRGVESLEIFGSFARDQALETSDVDLIVAFSMPVGLAMFTLQDDLSARLGAPADLVTDLALAPDIRLTALRDAVDAGGGNVFACRRSRSGSAVFRLGRKVLRRRRLGRVPLQSSGDVRAFLLLQQRVLLI